MCLGKSSGGLRKLDVEECIMRLVQGMYANAGSIWIRSRIHVDEGYSEEFEVKGSVHQGSVLSLLLFIIVLETCYLSSALGSPGRTSMPMTLLSY